MENLAESGKSDGNKRDGELSLRNCRFTRSVGLLTATTTFLSFPAKPGTQIKLSLFPKGKAFWKYRIKLCCHGGVEFCIDTAASNVTGYVSRLCLQLKI